jgi:hypothetical protein
MKIQQNRFESRIGFASLAILYISEDLLHQIVRLTYADSVLVAASSAFADVDGEDEDAV